MKLLVKTKGGIVSRRRGGHGFSPDALEVDVSEEAAKAILEDVHLLAKVVVVAAAPAVEPEPESPPEPEAPPVASKSKKEK